MYVYAGILSSCTFLNLQTIFTFCCRGKELHVECKGGKYLLVVWGVWAYHGCTSCVFLSVCVVTIVVIVLLERGGVREREVGEKGGER